MFFILTFLASLLISLTLVIPLSRNPIYSVLSFISIILIFGSIFIFVLNLELLGLILILVYAGAIPVLFLFIIMMLNIRIIELSKIFFGYMFVSFFLFLLFLYQLSYFITMDFVFLVSLLEPMGIYDMEWNYTVLVHVLVYVVYNYLSFWLLLVSVIPLISMVGSILLTPRNNVTMKKQTFLKQVARRSSRMLFYKCIY